MNRKIGVVDVGGGYRGVYAAGVLDYCMHKGIRFDLGIGVRAGSSNLASYCAGQPLRNHKFYTEYGLRKECRNFISFHRNRSNSQLEYIYGTLTNSDGEYPLHYEAMMDNPMEFVTVITEANSGEALYIPKSDLRKDQYTPFMASSATPVVCRPVMIDGTPYYDGTLSDPIPIQLAFNLGCEKVVLILAQPVNTVRTEKWDNRFARHIAKEFPYAAKALQNRARKYKESIALGQQYITEGRLLIIVPDHRYGVHTLCQNADSMNRLYEKGYVDAAKITPFLLS